MPEIRCPMCSTANDEAAEVCRECGARLMPLVLDGDLGAEGDPGLAEASSAHDGEGEDWLERIRSGIEEIEDPDEPAELPTAGTIEAPGWLDNLPEARTTDDEGPPTGELPGWMDEFIAAGGSDEEQEEEVPEWLARIRARQDSGTSDQDAADDASWISRLREEEGEPPAAGKTPRPEGLEGLAPAPKSEEEPKTNPFSTPIDLGPLTDMPGVPGSPDRALRRSEVAKAQADLDEGESLAPGERAKQAPALIQGKPTDRPVVTIDSDSLDSVELPDWLSELKPEMPPARPEDQESAARGADLAPATLPSWLEAMRPVDSFRPDIELDSDDALAVESAGPLTGLRGVLMAEPVVAMPRTSSTISGQLEITERQFAQAELLHRLVEEEERDVSAPVPAGRRFPIARWAISLILFLALFLPGSFERLGFPGFSIPNVVPREMQPLIDLVGGIPSDKPALFVFDFTPGYSGELDTVASTAIRHVLDQAVPIVTISTRPSGPPMAERLLREVSASSPLVNGAHYLHLGYLSGGPTAVQLFAVSPRESILTGFLLPDGLNRSTVWESPLVRDIQRLSDFGAIFVITAGTETARTWAEQTHPWIGETPLIMVLSAGAEPLVRPYFEAVDQRVQGILTGLPSALAYQQLNGQELTVQSRWNAYGSMMFAVEMILIAGGVYGGINWLWTQRRQGREDPSG